LNSRSNEEVKVHDAGIMKSRERALKHPDSSSHRQQIASASSERDDKRDDISDSKAAES
jgi:hypothetical protein